MSQESEYRHKSAAEREKELNFLIARDGRNCTKKYGYGCGRTFEELRMDEARARKMNGKMRKSPIINIDHINGNSNQRDGPSGEYCGNEQILCVPCHLVKTARDRMNKKALILGQSQREAPLEMIKNIKSEPYWVKEVLAYIHENNSICLSIARYGFPEISDATTFRYLKKRLVSIRKDLDPMLESGWGRCDSALCNGVHIYFFGSAPRSEEQDSVSIEE